MKTSGLSIEELSFRERILWSLALVALIELGNLIPLPGVDYDLLAKLNQPGSNAEFTQYLNMFVDIDLVDLGFFSLSIYPYINASIVFQLLTSFLPKWKELQKEEGGFGRRLLNQYLRLFTVAFALVQSLGIAFLLKPFLFSWNIPSATSLVLTLTTGSMIVLWISEVITRFGATNGSSFIVLFTILGKLPSLGESIIKILLYDKDLLKILVICFVLYFIMSCVIFVQESVRTVPLVLVRQEIQKVYLPFRLNQAGVMPLICSSAMMANFSNLEAAINTQLFRAISNSTNLSLIQNSVIYLNQFTYNIIYFFLVIFFTYIYSSIVIDPIDISGDLRKLTANIPDIRPGVSTIDFLENVLKRTNFLGGTVLGICVLMINALNYFIQLPNIGTLGVGAQLIMIGVILDILKKGELWLIGDKLKKESEDSN